LPEAVFFADADFVVVLFFDAADFDVLDFADFEAAFFSAFSSAVTTFAGFAFLVTLKE